MSSLLTLLEKNIFALQRTQPVTTSVGFAGIITDMLVGQICQPSLVVDVLLQLDSNRKIWKWKNVPRKLSLQRLPSGPVVGMTTEKQTTALVAPAGIVKEQMQLWWSGQCLGTGGAGAWSGQWQMTVRSGNQGPWLQAHQHSRMNWWFY